VEADREEEVKLRGWGVVEFVKEVVFKPGVKAVSSCLQCQRQYKFL